MAILATLRQSGGINALARQMGQPPALVTAAANALLPGLIERFRQCSGGMPGLLRVIEEVGGAGMAQAIMTDDEVNVQPGMLLLARIGNVSSIPTDNPPAGRLAPDLEARLTILLAMLLGGYLSARAASGAMSEAELSALLEARKSFYGAGDEAV